MKTQRKPATIMKLINKGMERRLEINSVTHKSECDQIYLKQAELVKELGEVIGMNNVPESQKGRLQGALLNAGLVDDDLWVAHLLGDGNWC